MKTKEIKIIYSSLDTQLKGDDLKIYNALMYSSYEAKEEFRKLNILRGIISENSAQSFHNGFSNRVIKRLRRRLIAQAEQMVNYTFSIIFRRASVIGLSFLLLLIIFNITITGNFSFYGIFGIKRQSLDLVVNLF